MIGKIILIALLAISLIIKIAKHVSNKKNSIEIKAKPINDILENSDPDCMADDMDVYLSEKCEHGDKLEKLNEKQRVIYVVKLLESEVNNGGFSQFFYNSSGEVANELVSAFEEIGANSTAQICKKAISIYGAAVPTDRTERQELIVDENNETEEFLEECDSAFFEYPDNLAELCYQYIINNKSYFLE